MIMQQLILIFHVLACFSLIALIVMQRGKGAEAGAAFGSGASQTVFGSRGAGTFLIKITSVLAVVFFSTSIVLNYLSSHHGEQNTLEALLPAAAGEIPLDNTLNKIQDKFSPSTLPIEEHSEPKNGVKAKKNSEDLLKEK